MEGRGWRRAIVALALVFSPPIAGAQAPEQPCHGDLDGDRRVTIAEIVLAVNHSLYGCPGATPLASPTPRATATPGTLELQILQTVGRDLVPSPGQFGCSASPLSSREGSARLTCELPVAFAFASIDRYQDAAAAYAAFEEMRSSAELSDFHGYDAFETTGESIGLAPSMILYWHAERWVIRTAQVTVFENVTVYRDIAESVFAEAVDRGLFPEIAAPLP
jgi:hypothetical protein